VGGRLTKALEPKQLAGALRRIQVLNHLAPSSYTCSARAWRGGRETMPRKIRALRAELRRAGWDVVRQSGSHQIWKHPRVAGVELNVAGHDGDDARHYQERDVREALRLAAAAQRRQP
jgi:predicted RNA binding protein YcfA (HicA-like mRNA interferase family)